MRPPDDLYRGIAAQYDAQQMDWYAPTFGPRLFALLDARGIAPGRLLDAGCGTGTLALSAVARGWTATGVDRSPSLLDRARAKDPAGRVRWIEGDLQGLDLGERFVVHVEDERERAAHAVAGHKVGGRRELRAAMPGIVVDIKVAEGDAVEEGQTLVVLEAMKMQNPLQAESSGRILRVACKKGEAVTAGALLLEME